MTFLILIPMLIAAAPLPDGGTIEVVDADGGDVPIVAPKLTPTLAPILAPELVPDAGATTMVAPPSLSVYVVDVPAEVALTAGAISLALIVDVMIKPSLEGDESCLRPTGDGRCNPDDLSKFDRYAVGKVSEPWGLFSDVALYASIALPTLYLGLESLVLPTKTPVGDWLKDLLVVSEAMAMTAVAQTTFKFAFRRPRPARYLATAAAAASFDQELSFPSGHTSMVAAATTALTTTVFLRHPESPVRFVILGSGALLTILTGVARVESGHHFPTDVIIGMALGGFAGFLVPWLHRNKTSLVPTASFNPVGGGSSFGVAGRF